MHDLPSPLRKWEHNVIEDDDIKRMLDRDRIAMIVFIDLNPLAGPFHTKESARQQVEAMLLTKIPHYNPVVLPFDD